MSPLARHLVAATRRPFATLAVAAIVVGATSTSARSFRYDAAGRLVLAVYDDGTALRYTYTYGDNILSVRRLRLPPAPGDLAAERSSPGSVRLTWSDRSPNELGFVVMRRAVDSSAWTTVATLPPNSVSYADDGLRADRNYVYRLAALADTDGLTSAYTSEAAAGGAGGVGFSITTFRPLLDTAPSPLVLSFEGASRASYRLESSTDLKPGSWQPEPWKAGPDQAASLNAIPGLDGPVTIYLDGSSADTARYFRVRSLPPD